jgi:hypothetical protein
VWALKDRGGVLEAGAKMAAMLSSDVLVRYVLVVMGYQTDPAMRVFSYAGEVR